MSLEGQKGLRDDQGEESSNIQEGIDNLNKALQFASGLRRRHGIYEPDVSRAGGYAVR